MVWLGYASMFISALGFGSNYIPVKRCETGNGIAFQFFFCTAVSLCGVAVGWYRGFVHTPPIALFGGFLWATGNMLSIPAIKCLGMGLSILIWGASNLLFGWASGTFGLFNLKARPASNITLNYAGVATCIVALIVYLFIKPHDADPMQQQQQSHRSSSKDGALLLLQRSLLSTDRSNSNEGGIRDRYGGIMWILSLTLFFGRGGADSFLPEVTGKKRMLLGCSLALLAGALYGCSFDPSTAVIDHSTDSGSPYYGCSSSTLDYVFPHFNGIFLTSANYFIVYLIILALRRQAPEIFPSSILPALASGFLWAVAMVCWFVANDQLPLSITFPITTSCPGLVASIWGVLVFKEIRGRRNMILLSCAFSLTLLACILIALSM